MNDYIHTPHTHMIQGKFFFIIKKNVCKSSKIKSSWIAPGGGGGFLFYLFFLGGGDFRYFCIAFNSRYEMYMYLRYRKTK